MPRDPLIRVGNGMEEVYWRRNVRPRAMATVSLYVSAGEDLGFDVSTTTSPDGNCVAYGGVIKCPIWNGSSLGDVGRVPDWVKDRWRL
jgi:hypothetical protein